MIDEVMLHSVCVCVHWLICLSTCSRDHPAVLITRQGYFPLDLRGNIGVCDYCPSNNRWLGFSQPPKACGILRFYVYASIRTALLNTGFDECESRQIAISLRDYRGQAFFNESMLQGHGCYLMATARNGMSMRYLRVLCTRGNKIPALPYYLISKFASHALYDVPHISVKKELYSGL